nr:hypothetical protein [Tanacetum cinerariifolium]
MLADAKLPVTFWAKAVNTACYVQNRVLVNKSHNKTPYELFNGRSPAIGFLKSFGCHVMILNTLDNLRKFEEKEDERYFIGYSMSSKVFRVFNKRTRRVKENLHVEFLENKAIEKAKKDVSSLRYIALSNWAHDALLEYSSSKPQDHCSTEVPEGSGNPNPTASTSNPPAAQMETLTVETHIPTVSSPVPTAYFTDSQEPSSDTRLILKRVANQEETPSLDKILSLINRCEDILEVTTNSDESNGVEADISNMETAITASPTPTLRIHKDHPKENPWGKDRTGKDVDLHLYRSMIGSLMYLTASRPDIMFAVCACARHQVTPKECHLHAVKRIFRYLKGHPKLGLWYPKESPFDLVAYSDSDYGGATQDRKSTTEGCQFLGIRSCPNEAKARKIELKLGISSEGEKGKEL